MKEVLGALARRVESDPFFLAAVLADYARSEGLDDTGLVAALGCRLEDLPMLRLCRAPRADALGFREDLADIAGRFGLEQERLLVVIRQGQAVCHLRQATQTSAEPGFLLAARDAPPNTPEPPP